MNDRQQADDSSASPERTGEAEANCLHCAHSMDDHGTDPEEQRLIAKGRFNPDTSCAACSCAAFLVAEAG